MKEITTFNDKIKESIVKDISSPESTKYVSTFECLL
jgi:hypothetical protein